MQIDEFKIGMDFWCSGKQWKCTDVGSRVIVAIPITMDKRDLNGPPYSVCEFVFDEYDQEGCLKTQTNEDIS